MSEFYENLAATAARLIAQFGATVNLKRTTGESIDPVTGAVTPGVETVHTPNGIFKEYSDNMIDGTRIIAGDRLLILDNTIAPLVTDEVEVGGEYWNIIPPIKTKSPAGIDLVHFVQVRR